MGGSSVKWRQWPALARWALLVGVLVQVAGFVLLTFTRPPMGGHGVKAAYINYTGAMGTALMGDEAWLLDTEPLVLHTKWNYREPLGFEGLLPRQEAFFAPYEARLDVGGLTGGDVRQQVGSVSTVRLLEQGLNPLRGVGPGRENAIQAFPKGGNRGEGLALWFYPLEGAGSGVEKRIELGDFAEEGEGLWTPLAVQLYVHPGGVASEPLVLSGSSNVALDAQLLERLAEALQRVPLPAGHYRGVIGLGDRPGGKK